MKVVDLRKIDRRISTISAISLSPSRKLVLVGGRECLQILHVPDPFCDDKSFAEHNPRVAHNLRGKRAAKQQAALRIQWNQLEESRAVYSSLNPSTNLLDTQVGKVLRDFSHIKG
mmetsp:Transcript_17513/g.29508  ORF Transcript_17513/g.29508 Transcript_17513/m.29508 type:complete len:115 (+) Transcript_17513:22-366(+)